MANETWAESLELGSYCEQLVYAYLRSTGATINDVTADAEYQAQEIDAVITLPDGSQRAIEIKGDRQIAGTGNLFVEHRIRLYNSGTWRNGWYHTSKADYLYYVDVVNMWLYIIPMDGLRAYIAEYTDENYYGLGMKECPDTDKNRLVKGITVKVDRFGTWLKEHGYKAKRVKLKAVA